MAIALISVDDRPLAKRLTRDGVQHCITCAIFGIAIYVSET